MAAVARREDPQTLGDALWQARKAKGMTQTALAAATELQISTISKLENDKVERPHRGTLRLIARALDVPYAHFAKLVPALVPTLVAANVKPKAKAKPKRTVRRRG